MKEYLNKWWVSGLFDAEGCFVVNIFKDNVRSTGYNIIISLEIAMNYKEKKLIENIKNTFNIGNIYYNTYDNTYKWKVSNLNEISDIMIPHFKNYKLLTQKRADFQIFEKIVKLIKEKKHLTKKGLQKIVNLKTGLNLGLSNKLIENFPNVKMIPKPEVIFKEIPDPNWLSGFVEGESCFYISIYKSPKSKIGLAIQLIFKITQHSRDIKLIKGIVEYLKCGRVEIRKNNLGCDFTVTSFKELKEIIIPFFKKYPLQSSKLWNFKAFTKVLEIMEGKEHLTVQGMKKIQEIKAGMNKGIK